MLSERIVSAVMRVLNERYLAIGHEPGLRLPDPDPGKTYMLYAHVPFCERLCPYCSFNRFPFEEDRARAYFRRLREEMRMVADRGFRFGSLYVGGGTPTILVDELCETLDLARELFGELEVSSETNPNHLIEEVVEPLSGRVHRFSVGVQSFDDTLLRQMDRYDKYGGGAETLAAIERTAGRFRSLNVDLIFNFPSQTGEMLARDVEMLKVSGADQVTFYPLMASPAVRRTLAETVGKVDYTREARYYASLSQDLLPDFEPSSAWCFSRTRHDDAGAREEMIDEYIVDYDEYVGIGSGAFSFLDGAIRVDTFSLNEYDALVGAGEMAVTGVRRFSRRELMRYRFLMGLFGLRLDKRAFARDFEVPIERGLLPEVSFMRAVGAFARDDDVAFTLTEKGRYLLVAMMREFFAGVNNVRDQAREALPADERELLFGEGEESAPAADCVPDEAHLVSEAAMQTEDSRGAAPGR
ncbi:MAG: coproporphyrinogen III oxidase family protein [Coriobacteriia bacterium]|nr:coproporphyrinogen III oxidase family protein [Coriobacteriia bacterium]